MKRSNIPPENRPGLALQPNRVCLPQSGSGLIIDYLARRYSRVSRATWDDRFRRGLVVDQDNIPLSATTPFRPHLIFYFYREVEVEPVVPMELRVVHETAHFLIVHKPPFLPVNPGGNYVNETVIGRLVAMGYGDNIEASHQLDRLTEGLVLVCKSVANRDHYHRLFREGEITKRYEAISVFEPTSWSRREWLDHQSRIERGNPSFTMHETPGVANSHSRIQYLDGRDQRHRYALQPITGKTHQLRVHMAALGVPILNDPFYPALVAKSDDNYLKPLKLKARQLQFTDPLSGKRVNCDIGPICY